MIPKIIIRNLLYKPSATVLSILLLMFGTGIISLLLLLYTQIEKKFNNDLKDIDLVIGAKGSPLQLVLSAVYHIDAPTGNIQKKDVDRITNNPLVEQAIPLAYGDSYKSFRIVGTDSNYLSKYSATLNQGTAFHNEMEVVLGSGVAALTGMKPGSTFFGTHGLGKEGHVHEEFAYKVTGILNESNTVLDNLILTTVETVWHIHEHHEEGEEHHDDDGDYHAKEDSADNSANEVTAVLVKYRSPQALMMLPRSINETTNMQAASPVLEMNRLFQLMGIGVTTMQLVAFSIMLLSGISVFISLFNRLRERKYELALARSMGCSRGKLFIMILSEGLLLSVAGFICGIVISRIGIFLLEKYTARGYHLQLNKAGFQKEEIYLLLITLGVGLFASVIPAIKAFNLNISKTLSHE